MDVASPATGADRSLLDLVFLDAPAARRQATSTLADDAATPAARAVALRALAIVDRADGHVVRAEQHCRDALAVLGDAHPDLHAEVRTTLALTRGYQGAWDEALAMVESALADIPPDRLGRPLAQLAVILQRTGRNAESLPAHRDAIATLRATGDTLGLALGLGNAGLAVAEAGDLRQGREWLEEARALAHDLGTVQLELIATCNVGYVATRQGDLVAALAALTDCEEINRRAGNADDVLLPARLDRAQALAEAGLWSEAATLAMAVGSAMGREENAAQAAEGLLRAARILLACGRHDQVADLAGQAAARLDPAQAPGWWGQAQYLSAMTADPDHLRRDGTRLAEDLDRLGWPVEAGEVRLLAADQALQDGRPGLARSLLAGLTDAEAPDLPIARRVQVQVAAATLARAVDDPVGVEQAAREGVALLSAHRRSLGSLELRAAAGTHLRQLTQLWLADAMGTGDPWTVLEVLESTTAVTSGTRTVRPARDPAMVQALLALREVDEALLAAAGDPSRTMQLEAQRVRLEQEVTDRDRASDGGGRTTPRAVGADGLAAASHGTHLVHAVVVDGQVWAVSLRDGVAHLDHVAAEAQVRSVTERLVATALRTLRGRGADEAVLRSGVEALQDLLAPLGLEAGRPLVLVGGAGLSGVPWGLLPQVRPAGWCLTESLGAWAANAPARDRLTRPGPADRVLLVQGPGLPAAAEEVAGLRRLHPAAEVLGDGAATGEAVRVRLPGSVLAHLCAHGHVNAENPLLSSIRLDDGPLWGHELAELTDLPAVVVLAACSVGSQRRYDGGALLGLASVLLHGGAGTVVAPTLPVADQVAAQVGVAVHRHLRAGATVPAAVGLALDAVEASPADRFAIRTAQQVLQ